MEFWINIDNDGWYSVSSKGRVRSNARTVLRGEKPFTVAERILKPAIDAKGYQRVALSVNNKLVTHKVHRLVATAFLPPAHPPANHVNHINGVKTDNTVQNLAWVTPSENSIHAIQTGLLKPKSGYDHHRSVTSKEDREGIVRMKNEGHTNSEIAKRYGISVSCVKRTYKHEVNRKAD